jgi:hypothetical protein
MSSSGAQFAPVDYRFGTDCCPTPCKSGTDGKGISLAWERGYCSFGVGYSSSSILTSPMLPAFLVLLFRAFTEKFITVRPTCTALLYPGRRGVLYLTKTKVPNLLWLSSSMNLPFSSLILAWQRDTEISLIRRSLS